jgi:hypothetical protein
MAFVDDGNPGEMPTLLESYDEYTSEAWNGVPDFYTEALEKRKDQQVRELIVSIPDSVVEGLFGTREYLVPTHQIEPVE